MGAGSAEAEGDQLEGAQSEGDDAVAEWRTMMGPTNPVNAAPGSSPSTAPRCRLRSPSTTGSAAPVAVAADLSRRKRRALELFDRVKQRVQGPDVAADELAFVFGPVDAGHVEHDVRAADGVGSTVLHHAARRDDAERGTGGENPYKVQADLQESMQALVGIVRMEGEMKEALTRIAGFKVPKSVDVIEALPRNPSGKILPFFFCHLG